MKLCKDCRYYLRKSGDTAPWCNHPDSRYQEPVEGLWHKPLCREARDQIAPCGPEGRLWEQWGS